MEPLLEGFTYLSDVPIKVDELIEQAKHTRNQKEKRDLMQQAQDLADAYQRDAEANGNDTKQFNKII